MPGFRDFANAVQNGALQHLPTLTVDGRLFTAFYGQADDDRISIRYRDARARESSSEIAVRIDRNGTNGGTIYAIGQMGDVQFETRTGIPLSEDAQRSFDRVEDALEGAYRDRNQRLHGGGIRLFPNRKDGGINLGRSGVALAPDDAPHYQELPSRPPGATAKTRD